MAMTYDQFLTRGLDGRELWETIKHKCTSHNDILAEMRNRQEQLAVLGKHPIGEKEKSGITRFEESLLTDIKFLETMAWRVYMFGSRSLFSRKPGKDGEFAKRVRTDTTYHKKRDFEMSRFGEAGCQAENNIFNTIQRKCLAPGCKHRAVSLAHKAIKRAIRKTWEDEILRKYNY